MMGVHNYLLGKTGTGHDQARTSSMVYNPAHISEISRPSVGASTGLEFYSYTYRFIGDTAKDNSHIGFAGIPFPTIVYPFNKALIFGGFIIPIPIPTKVEAKKVPMGLFGQLNHADIGGKATLKFFADIYANIYKNPVLSVAANIYYSSIEADIGVRASGYSGDSLVDVTLTNSNFSLKVGSKLKINSRLYLGVSSTLFTYTSTSTQMNTILNEDKDGDGSADPSDAVSSSSSIPIKNLRVGTSVKATPRLILYFDADYQRNVSTKQFSLVDLVEKEKDVSDTLSVYLGGEYVMNPKRQILVGGFYEPASVGPGGQGANTKTGFGFMDLAMSLGSPPSLPAWGVGGGIRMGFMKKRHKKHSSSKRNTQVYTRYTPTYQLTLDAGLVFSKTSIGIGENGEQPASYEVTRFTVPLEVHYTF